MECFLLRAGPGWMPHSHRFSLPFFYPQPWWSLSYSRLGLKALFGMFDLVCLKTGTKPFLLMILKEKEQSKDILDFTHKDEFTAFIYIQHNFILSHPFVCFGIPNLCSSTSAGPHHIVNMWGGSEHSQSVSPLYGSLGFTYQNPSPSSVSSAFYSMCCPITFWGHSCSVWEVYLEVHLEHNGGNHINRYYLMS